MTANGRFLRQILQAQKRRLRSLFGAASYFQKLDVRFGSLADIGAAKADVRFAPKAHRGVLG